MTEPTTNTTEPAKTDDVEDFADRLVRLAQRRRHEQVQSKNQNLRAQMAAHEEKPAPVESTAYPEQWFNDWLQAGFAETCGRRRTMEDAHCLEAKFRPSQKEQVFIGVYDGHGGKEAADMVGTELHTIFKNKLQQYDELVQLLRDIGDEPDQTILDRVRTANRELVPRLSQLILLDNNRNEIKKVQQQESVHQLLGAQEQKKQSGDDAFEKETSVAPIEIYNMNERQVIPLLLRESFLECNERVCETIRSGATASVAYFKDDTCYVANVGDSRIITIDSAGEIKRLTVDHRPDSSDEERRVKDAGGFIANKRVNAVLAVTRALGDADLHPYVSSDPYTSTVAVRPGQLFIIACDGVWDFVKDEQAYELIKDEKDARKASVMLRDFAYQQGSTDNISVIVVRVL